ncbi:unnamed protein product [Gongylonema pulchrum]|uniref:Guanylate cyclase domain-containing protein n=1 Tax=Gongylonema pulchrum TaxID=637853 RepID=A0A183DI95_9BILA|nr:unnamed protein product [Gongylonema pulchrum]
MQSNCQANQIQMAESTAKLLMESSKYKLTKRGIVHVKGKGDVNTYWLNEHVVEILEPPTKSTAQAEKAAAAVMPDLIEALGSDTTTLSPNMSAVNSTKAPQIPVQH